MIQRRSLLALLAGTAAAAGLAGCASPNPNLYAIAPVAGPAIGGGPRIVTLHTISLARYLERPQIVVSSEDYRLNVASNDWWGEPLGAMVGRTLAAELGQRLPGTSVFTESGAIAVDPDAIIEINLQRLDADRAGAVVLEAQLAVSYTDRTGPAANRRRGTTDARTVRIVVPPPTSGMTGQVAATSTALGQLADTLATMLRDGRHAGA